jgi:Histidine kinase-, DNA gyrase B-, and HSP90-like ATPase
MFSDLTQNAVEAGSSVITVVLNETDRDIALVIEDNGKGMTPEQLKRATDPFYTDGIKHPGRKVGLGIPFLIQTAETCGGQWNIRSEKGKGTVVTCRFDLTNIDTPPVGDVTGYFRQILTFDGRYEMVIERKTPSFSYTVRRSELLDALALADQGSFTDAGSLALLGQYLESMEE